MCPLDRRPKLTPPNSLYGVALSREFNVKGRQMDEVHTKL